MTLDRENQIVDCIDFLSIEGLWGRLRYYACSAASDDTGVVVVTSAENRSSMLALAQGVQDAGHGCIHIVDSKVPDNSSVSGLSLSDCDKAVSVELRKHGLDESLVRCVKYVASGVNPWVDGIMLLVIDEGSSYDAVSFHLQNFLPQIRKGGAVVLIGHELGSELEAAVRDYVPFSHFQTSERIANTLVLQRTAESRVMVLCGGMQSSGSTLVSMSFLQRGDMDGVYDMDNSLVQQDFSRISTDIVWVKMTVGSFRLKELADLYTAQGWRVRPLLVYREAEETMASLITKPYGMDGCNGDDPPLFVRLTRYMEDVEAAASHDWPVLDYAELIKSPEQELRRVCELLDLEFDSNMLTWPKAQDRIAYPALGSPSLNSTLETGIGLVETIARYQTRKDRKQNKAADESAATRAAVLVRYYRCFRFGQEDLDLPMLPPCIYRGTHRDRMAREIRQLCYFERLAKHPVIGLVVRLWAVLVNPKLRKRD
jgi:hypothetical protein